MDKTNVVSLYCPWRLDQTLNYLQIATIQQVLKDKTGLCAKSTFIDIGAGLGKPNLHVTIDPGVSLSYGIELIGERWQLSLANL